jgi:hypothetical protein
MYEKEEGFIYLGLRTDHLVIFAHLNEVVPLADTTITHHHHHHHHHTCEPLLVGQVGITDDNNNGGQQDHK